MNDSTDNRLFNSKELAAKLGVSPTFVKRMKAAGFPMPGERATIQWALDWLRANPNFRQSDHATPRKQMAEVESSQVA